MDILDELKMQCDAHPLDISYVVLHKAVDEIQSLRQQLEAADGLVESLRVMKIYANNEYCDHIADKSLATYESKRVKE